jgi:hypothetical protein
MGVISIPKCCKVFLPVYPIIYDEVVQELNVSGPPEPIGVVQTRRK